MTADEIPKRRFLVCYDYGMGGLWWWIHARSAREITETFAETKVIEDTTRFSEEFTRNLTEVDIDEPSPPGLQDLREQRDAQRTRPGFGVLADRAVLYTRQRWNEAEDIAAAHYFTEIIDGYRTRQVEVRDTGESVRTGLDDFPLNPPIDLWDPDLAAHEITAAEFEKTWERAVPPPEGWYG
ncbi:hypothetical protein AB0L82_41575 [Nocardia sp. NPDC052001]|uniref:hypothetical protein n=1 Tax=Nocardia sp. NPDC052001 TaxID=3154853 RepID=UPI00343288D5